MRRPDHIAFGVNDPLPPRLALQQLAFLSADYYYPLQTTGAVLPGMYLVPGSGLDAVFGMVWVVGLTQIGFSFVILRMRNVFTTEVSGVAVMLIGLGLGALGLQQMFGTSTYSQPLSGTSLLAGALALATMVGCNVWAKGLLKLLAPLTGLLVGMALSLLLPQLPAFGWRFEAGAIVPYAVTGFALALTSMGTQTIVQRSADADWVRPLARGVRAEGVAHLFAASGSASRYLGYWTAALLLLAALVPKLIGAWLLLPAPVMGALLLYLATFTTLSGLQLIASRMLDNRRVLAVGLGLVVGTGMSVIQSAIQKLWPALAYVALSGLAAGVCVTVLILESQGRLWGARHEPVRRAELVGWQVIEALTSHHLVAGPLSEIEVETGFDEYIFTLIVRYRGGLLPLAKQPPSAEELMASTEAELQMAGYLVSQSAHSARASSNADGLCTLRLTFEN